MLIYSENLIDNSTMYIGNRLSGEDQLERKIQKQICKKAKYRVW